MTDVIEFVNRDIPVPAPDRRRRIRVEVGQYLLFRGDIALIVEREIRDDEQHRLVFRWLDTVGGHATTLAASPVFLGEHNGCRLVVRSITWRNDVPASALIELQAEPRNLLNAIEHAA